MSETPESTSARVEAVASQTAAGRSAPAFGSASVWAFYVSVVRRYWRRFAAMIVLTTSYTGVTVARLGAFAVLLALLRYAWGPEEQPLPDVLQSIDRAWVFLTGESLALERLRAGDDNSLLFTIFGWMLAAFGVAAVVSGVSFFYKQYLAQSIVFRGAADIREALFKHLTGQPVAYFNRRHSGDVISRLTNDVATVQLSFRFFFQDLVQEPIRIISMLTVACAAIPWLFGLVLPVYVIIMWPMFRAGKRIIRHGRGRQEKLGVVTEAIQQLFSGIRVVKAFGMEEHESRRFEEKSDGLVRSSLRMVKAKARGRSWQEFLYNVGIAVFLLVAIWLLAYQGLAPETLAIFIGALIETYQPIKSLSKAYNVLMESRAGVERVIEVLQVQPEIGDDPSLPSFPGVEREIRFENVYFSYDDVAPGPEERAATEDALAATGDEPGTVAVDTVFPGVIRGVSLHVGAGEVIAVVGPSGAGKSTLVDLLARFYDPQKGQIAVDDEDIRAYRRSSYRDAIAVVSQDPFLFHDTIRENIRYGRRGATDEQVEEAARVAFAHEFIVEQPSAYDTVIGERGVKLSGGQRQRLTIARAVLKDAPILILDEATSSLDTESEREVQRAMDNLMRNRTTFVIAHRLSTIVHADQIVVLDSGRVVERGRHEELLASRGIYWRLWETQSAASGEATAS